MSQPNVRFCLVLHNHQPIGNFDQVFRAAYEDSYRPFLDVFEQYPGICMSLHTSGSLMEWLQRNGSDYLNRIAELVARGRIEILGGAYTNDLTMLSAATASDRSRSTRRCCHDDSMLTCEACGFQSEFGNRH